MFCHIFGVATFGCVAAQLLNCHFTIFEGHLGTMLRFVVRFDNEKRKRDDMESEEREKKKRLLRRRR
jgi:hypothetical protein